MEIQYDIGGMLEYNVPDQQREGGHYIQQNTEVNKKGKGNIKGTKLYSTIYSAPTSGKIKTRVPKQV